MPLADEDVISDVELIPLQEPDEQPTDELVEELLPRPDADDERQWVADAMSDHDAAVLDRSDWQTSIKEWDDQYLGRLAPKEFPWPGCANFNVPLTMLGVETLKPRLVEAVTGSDPIVYAIPTEAMDEDRANTVQLFLPWQLRTELNIQPLVEESSHTFLTPGTVFAKIIWRQDVRRVKFIRKFPLETLIDDKFWRQLFDVDVPKDWAPADKPMSWEGTVSGPGDLTRKIRARLKYTETEIHVLVDREALVRDQPEISLPNPEDIIMPFNGGHIQKLPWVEHRLWYTPDELRRKVASGRFYKDSVQKLLGEQEPDGGTPDATEGTEVADARFASEGVTPQPASDVLQNEYEVRERYERRDVDDDSYDEEVVMWYSPSLPDMILGWDYLDNLYAHGMRPLVKGGYLMLPGRTLALSFPEVVRDLQDEINSIHNQRVDAGTIQNTPMGFFRASMTLRPQQMRVKPGDWVPVDNPQQDIFIPQWNGSPTWGFNEEALLYQTFERLTGLTDLALGRQPNRVGATRTASGTAALLSEAGLRFKTSMEAFQRFWTEVFEHVHALNQQYLPPGKEFRVTGRLPEVIRIEDRQSIAGRFHLRLSATTETMNKQVMREDAQVLMNVTMNPIGLQFGTVGIKAIRRAMSQFYRAYGQDPDMWLEPQMQVEVQTPEQELQRMVNGDDNVKPSMLENIQLHLDAHMSQAQDPATQTIPGLRERLMKHLAETYQMAQVQAFVQQQQQSRGPKDGPMGAQSSPVAGEQAQNAQIGRQADQPAQFGGGQKGMAA